MKGQAAAPALYSQYSEVYAGREQYYRESLLASDRTPTQTNLRKMRRVYWLINHGKDETGFRDVWNQVREHPLHAGFNFTDHFLHEVGDLGVGSFMVPSLQFCKRRQKSCSWRKRKRKKLQRSPPRHPIWDTLSP